MRVYLDSFPAGFSSFPIFYDHKQLAMLQGNRIVQEILEEKEQLRNDYKKVVEMLPELAKFTQEQFNQMVVVSWS